MVIVYGAIDLVTDKATNFICVDVFALCNELFWKAEINQKEVIFALFVKAEIGRF